MAATSLAAPRKVAWYPQSSYEWMKVLAFLCCLIFPVKQHFAGGVTHPRLLNMNLTGQTMIVTGANTGIGYETALQLARQNATVVLAGRSASRIAAAASSILAEVPTAHVEGMQLDLASLASVKSFADAFKAKHARLDVLIENAGVMFSPYGHTVDGFETTFGTNHLGHFYLTGLLLDTLKASAPSRVVVLSSRAHERGVIAFDDLNYKTRGEAGYNEGPVQGYAAYSQSKLANVLFARELSKRVEGTGVTAVSVHPGVVRTELSRYVFPPGSLMEYALWPVGYVLAKSPVQGAQTSLTAALDHTVPANAGAYYADCVPVDSPNAQANDPAVAERLWRVSEELVGLRYP